MTMAAILIGTGILVELCTVLLAPLGYQDDKGFHTVAENRDDDAQAGVQNPS
jgi:hypothetical protein